MPTSRTRDSWLPYSFVCIGDNCLLLMLARCRPTLLTFPGYEPLTMSSSPRLPRRSLPMQECTLKCHKASPSSSAMADTAEDINIGVQALAGPAGMAQCMKQDSLPRAEPCDSTSRQTHDKRHQNLAKYTTRGSASRPKALSQAKASHRKARQPPVHRSKLGHPNGQLEQRHSSHHPHYPRRRRVSLSRRH